MLQQQSTRQRPNRAFRIAYLPDTRRIQSVPVLNSITHAWSHELIAGLSAPASKLLRFLAALNRTGNFGYVGVALAYEILAERISDATEIKFSKRGVERAVAELKTKGLITVRPWTREGQYFLAGGRQVQMCGAGTVTLANGRVMPCQLAIIALTDDALSMWELPKRGGMCSSVAHEPTTAKLADTSSGSEQIDKSIMLKRPTRDVRTTVQEAKKGIEGRPTSPADPTNEQAGRPTVEHAALTGNLRLKPGPSAPFRVSQASNKASRLLPSSPPIATKGCSKPKPVFYRGPHPSSSSSIARIMILGGIFDFLQDHSPREADSVFCRAKLEIEGGGYKGWPTVVDWGYWIDAWPRLSPKEREVKLFRYIIPLLKNRKAITPCDPLRMCGNTVGARYRPPVGKVRLVNEDLIALVGRLGISDRFDV